jgi:pyruvate-ferredoxin/flavodoxin oxidoreductase
MGKSQLEAQLAVNSGYWPLYRYNPALRETGHHPFILDSKAPDGSLRTFLSGEVRYAALQQGFPQESERLVAQLEREYTARYQTLERLATVGVEDTP